MLTTESLKGTMGVEIERRTIPAKVELRATKDQAASTLGGYAALFGVRSQDLGGFVEEIDPGAFDKSLAEGDDVLARGEHDSRMLLGKKSSGTLRLSVDGKGLAYEVDLPDTTAGRDFGVLVARGDVTQSSFAFQTVRDRWEDLEGGTVLRTLLEVKLVDVAPVAMPAYTETSVSARALEAAKAAKIPPVDLEAERLRAETA